MKSMFVIALTFAALPMVVVLADSFGPQTETGHGHTGGASDDVPTRGPVGKATVIKDDQNIVSTELMGTWVVDEELSKRTGGASRESVKSTKMVFRESLDSSRLICNKLEALLPRVKGDKGQSVHDLLEESIRCIYLAGEMEYVKKDASSKHAFALVALRGNPYVLWHRVSRGKDDFESFNVMLVRDSKGDGDILFVGGDFAGESFTAFKREVAEKTEDGGSGEDSK